MESKGMDGMKFEKHFLPNDISQASSEYWCAMDMLTRTLEKLQAGNIEGAKQDSTDLLKSIHELSKMSSEKHQIDRVNKMVNQLNTSGVHVELLRRQLHDQ